ncbi:uncharacterized protein LOC124606066, partial [Schistocerca americana]|uniref:uncharacterized protein LOC124606066 n=1 Tax=Schistocerca americana TaxID=7009 RepID=UPI001F4F8B88
WLRSVQPASCPCVRARAACPESRRRPLRHASSHLATPPADRRLRSRNFPPLIESPLSRRHDIPSFRGPRSLFLRRCENGFGFTLRHFIVYPPESYTVLQGEKRLGVQHGHHGAALDEPMDTIFVKNVYENSPAHAAGLATGDRIISVNGLAVTGCSYAQVVQTIQHSGNFLHLLVVPKENDLLQLYFGETAHNPETNRRPSRLHSPGRGMLQQAAPPLRQYASPPPYRPLQQDPDFRSRRSSEGCDRDHSPFRSERRTSADNWGGYRATNSRVGPENPSSQVPESQHFGSQDSYLQLPGCRRSLDGGDGGGGGGGGGGGSRRESSSSLPSTDYLTPSDSKDSLYGSTSTLTGGRSSDDSIIIDRIRKSFEQKEEFLRRPNQPISWSVLENVVRNQQQHHQQQQQQQQQQQLLHHNHQQQHHLHHQQQIHQQQQLQYQQQQQNQCYQNHPQTAAQNSQSRAIIAREFYARPQKFQRPVWPPTNSASSLPSQIAPPSDERQESPVRTAGARVNHVRPLHQSLRRVKSDVDAERQSSACGSEDSSNRSVAEHRLPFERASSEPCEDRSVNRSQHNSLSAKLPYSPVVPIESANSQVRSVPAANRPGTGKTPFVTTLTRIHENIPAIDRRREFANSQSEFAFQNLQQPDQRSISRPTEDGPRRERSCERMQQVQPQQKENVAEWQRLSPEPELQPVYQRARQFEEGLLAEDRTSLYRSELARLSAKKSVPNVAVRKREFESRSTASPPSSSAVTRESRESRRTTRESRSLESAELSKKKKDGELINTGVSGNRMILVGSTKLHCEPPCDFKQFNVAPEPPSHEPLVRLRARSNSAESWAAAARNRMATASPRWEDEAARGRSCERDREKLWDRIQEQNKDINDKDRNLEWDAGEEPPRHRAVRQDSYLAAVRTPFGTERPNRLITHQTPQSVTEKEGGHPVVSSVCSQISPPRPTQLDIPNPARPAEMGPGAPAAEGDAVKGNTGHPSPHVPVVIRRQKATELIGEEDRHARRVSYLKATWGDRMHVDSDLELSDSEAPVFVEQRRRQQGWKSAQLVPDVERLVKIVEEVPPVIITSQCYGESNAPVEIGDEETDGKSQVIREGWLQCKVSLIEGKRSSDRSWRQLWVVLENTGLILYRAATCSDEEARVQPLHGVTVEVAAITGYTKRKNVIRLTVPTGSELLLQAEDEVTMNAWLHALQERVSTPHPHIVTADEEEAVKTQQTFGSTHLSPQPAHKGIRKLTSFRNRSPTGQSPVNKTRKPSQSDQLPSPKSKTWKGRVYQQFKRIQQGGGSPNSPTAPHPEGATIGIPLEECPPSKFSEYVPLLVEMCTSIVDTRGLDIIGIYRVPGNTAAVSSLTESLNKGFDWENMQDPRWNDVNVISSLLKLFFRRLPDSLFTNELYPSFIEADKIEDSNKRFARIKKLVHELPEHHFETLKYLMYHLKKVVAHSETNKMEARNLAIVFGPTLVRAADENMVTMVTDMSHQCRIVESLIQQVDWFFSDYDIDDPNNLPTNLPQDSNEMESANQNLLLSNIQKVEGMKGDSPNKDISAKDIVSSIISAANRKMQKAKAKKTTNTASLGVEEVFVDSQNHTEEKQRENSNQVHEGGTPEQDDAISQHVASDSPAGSDDKIYSRIEEEDLNREKENINVNSNPVNPICEKMHPDIRKYFSNDETTWTYSGLSATTQERIRRFELETKAMLQRDLTRQRHEQEEREKERRRIEAEWQQAKRELEGDDPLDSLADNPSDITNKIKKSDTSVQSTTSQIHKASPAAAFLTNTIMHQQALHGALTAERNNGKETGSTVPSNKSTTDLHHKMLSNDTSHKPEASGSHSRKLNESQPRNLLRRGSSAENLQALEEVSQKGVINSMLKRLKTEKENVELSQPLTSLRCGSLDSLHETHLTEHPTASDISDDGGCFFSWTRKILAINKKISRQAAGPGFWCFLSQLPQPQPQTQPGSGVGGICNSAGSITGPGPTPAAAEALGRLRRGSDLLASFTSTFDRKLKSLLSTTQVAEEDENKIYRDPSLHRGRSVHSWDACVKEGCDAELPRSQNRESSTGQKNVSEHKAVLSDLKNTSNLEKVDTQSAEKTDQGLMSNSKTKSSESAANNEKTDLTRNSKLRRSGSLTKADKSETLANTKLRRSESLTKAERYELLSTTKLKRSDSLTKTEKTESNNSKRKQEMRTLRGYGREKENVAILVKLKRKNGMPERSIKRRHTVGGTKDFDKLHWVDNRLQYQQQQLNEKEDKERRTSSPELSSHSLPEPIPPLESHV